MRIILYNPVMGTIAAKVLSLLMSGQNAFIGDDILSLKNRFMFLLLDKSLSPKELTEALRQDKSNVAHLAAALEKSGHIVKTVIKSDRRRVRYALSLNGRAQIEAALNGAEEKFKNFLDSAGSMAAAEEKIDEVLYLFSFL